MSYVIHTIELEDEFKICPECGYSDGFHTMLIRKEQEVRPLYICPSCHFVYDVVNSRPD